MYIDGFEPLISQVNMMEISHSGIIDDKLKAWFMKELIAPGRYTHTHTHTHTHIMSIIDNIISAM